MKEFEVNIRRANETNDTAWGAELGATIQKLRQEDPEFATALVRIASKHDQLEAALNQGGYEWYVLTGVSHEKRKEIARHMELIRGDIAPHLVEMHIKDIIKILDQ